jgi:hypothetical protein
MPPHTPTRDRARPDLAAPPAEPLDAIGWAILQKPEPWALGEWLARLLPEGSWAEMEDDELADYLVGAAVRARTEEPPK